MQVILMMLMVLVVAALLAVVADPYQKELGLEYLEDVYTANGANGTNPLFQSFLQFYRRGDPIGTVARSAACVRSLIDAGRPWLG